MDTGNYHPGYSRFSGGEPRGKRVRGGAKGTRTNGEDGENKETERKIMEGKTNKRRRENRKRMRAEGRRVLVPVGYCDPPSCSCANIANSFFASLFCGAYPFIIVQSPTFAVTTAAVPLLVVCPHSVMSYFLTNVIASPCLCYPPPHFFSTRRRTM